MAKKDSNEVIEGLTTDSIELVVNSSFTDKYNSEKHYKTGDVITVSVERANELLADNRNLVSKV